MRLPQLLHLLLPLVASFASLSSSFILPQSLNDQRPIPQHASLPASNDPSTLSYKIPTRYESTVLARRMLALSDTGVMSTVFPPSSNTSSSLFPSTEEDLHAYENRPATVENTPFGMIDYIANCEESTGNPTILGINIATTFLNAAPEVDDRVRNISLSLDWWTKYRTLKQERHHGHHTQDIESTNFDLGLYSPASLPRVTLIGHLEPIPSSTLHTLQIPTCFLHTHPDAAWWAPANPDAPHSGRWLRMVVEEIYWFGGFGDRAYIGWLDPRDWKGVEKGEWEGVRLPGEGK